MSVGDFMICSDSRFFAIYGFLKIFISIILLLFYYGFLALCVLVVLLFILSPFIVL